MAYVAPLRPSVLFLLVLLHAALVFEEVHGAPAKRSDILAGTEFLSVFINGAMAPPPQRRRGFRRGGAAGGDSAPAESHQHEASIYRISRNPSGRPVVPRANNGNSPREEVVRFYPISQRNLENRQQALTTMIDEPGDAATSTSSPRTSTARNQKSNSTSQAGSSLNRGISRQKVIGVSVTSTVEATPYKVRVEHYDTDSTVVTRPPGNNSSTKDESRSTSRSTTRTASSRRGSTTSTTTTTTTTISPLPSRFVTEELSNVVSESNRSEFSVDEGSPSTSWRSQSSVTPTTSRLTEDGKEGDDMITLPTEENYELPEENSEVSEALIELQSEMLQPQGRKAGRHYDGSHYNRPGSKYPQPSKSYKPSRQFSEPAKVYGEPAKVYGEPEKVYGEPAKVYGEPAKVYGEPAKVYGEPAKVYSEPAKVYGEPEKVYSQPSKVYSEPARIYSEPSKVYSQPSKVYSEPSKVYDADGHPVQSEPDEPDEENYEVDESVSVGSNGNVHGPQLIVTDPANESDTDDGHKVEFVVEGKNYRKYRVEERTPDGFIVGEYGVVSHDDGSLRGVRYTADGTINPRLIYDALMKFLAL